MQHKGHRGHQGNVLVIRSQRIVLPEGERAAALYIEDGVIAKIAAFTTDDPTGAKVFNVPDLVISPGLVDTHVHINQPGRTEWEGFDTATRAAAAGGVTTLIDMPLNSIPATTSVSGLRAKVKAAQAQCHVDVGFWGGVVPGNRGEIEALIDAGVRGFKCFLVPSGVDEFPAVSEDDLRWALPILARRNVPLLVHAEDPALIAEPSGPTYEAYLASRPAASEAEAVRLMIRLAEEFNARVHIVHVSSADAVTASAGAKAAGVPITAETCPHYLTFAAGEIGAGSSECKCAPPIRDAAHRAALWDGLASGALDLIATHHSPAPPALKTPGDFRRAWGGIASLELSLAATYTSFKSHLATLESEPSTLAVESPDVTVLPLLARWMSAAPAALAGLGGRKGRIAQGLDADLVAWDPEVEWTVDAARLQQRHKLTPYAGRSLFGAVLTTFVRGERVWDRDRLARAYGGQLL